ncbi:MAG: DUF4105 domain-containing protein [Rubricoccaceae bacterium]
MRLPVLMLLLLAPTALAAQGEGRSQGALPVPLPERAAGLSDSARVSLLTMLPGREVYSLFGHSALRIADPATGLDKTYNFGTFDFEQPFFVPRFVRGSLDYILATAPMAYELERYVYLGRPIIEQRLALPPEVARALHARLEVNALPEHRAYRYDFFFDNCSTRLLDVLDAALVETGRAPVALPAAPGVPTPTFRDALHPYLAADPLLRLGIDLALGLPADRPMTRREESFLPLRLADLLDGARVDGRPLVAARDTLFWARGAGLPPRAPDTPLLAALALAALALAALAVRRFDRAGPRTRALAHGLTVALFVVAGLTGLLLAFLWLGTAHTVTGPNLNLLWAWPTHLWAAFHLGRPTRAWRRYFGAAAVAHGTVLLLAAFLAQPLPAAILPLVGLLALAAADAAVRPRRSARAALPVHEPA